MGCGAMMWKKERDLLIAQTMAFVQSVAGKTAEADRKFEDRKFEARLPQVTPVQPLRAERPADVRPPDVLPARLAPIRHSDLREEIQRRVTAFRARQQAFHRDRNEYCNAVMAKVRAASEQARARENQLPKHR
jgi:hypothetical protein